MDNDQFTRIGLVAAIIAILIPLLNICLAIGQASALGKGARIGTKVIKRIIR